VTSSKNNGKRTSGHNGFASLEKLLVPVSYPLHRHAWPPSDDLTPSTRARASVRPRGPYDFMRAWTNTWIHIVYHSH